MNNIVQNMIPIQAGFPTCRTCHYDI